MKESAGKLRKVLIIVENLPVPFDRRVWQEASALHDAGYQVSIICPVGKGYEKRHEVIEDIHIYRHPLPWEGSGAAGYCLEYASALFWEFLLAWRVLFQRGFDVIHACNPPDNIFCIGLCFKLLGKKFIFDHHDINPELYEAKFGRRDFFYRVMLAWERWTFKTADVSIATNESYRRIAIERGGMSPDRVFVVRSGPNLERLKIQPPDETLKRGRRYLVGYVGVMGKQEGIDYLLRAVRYLVRTLGRTDIHFGLVGGGTELEAMRQYALELDISEYVTFTGRVPDDEMLAMLNTADICVNPDVANEMNDKSTMNKIMEYMALGKPIVQFDLTEGRFSAREASLYAARNDEQDLAEKIAALLDDPPKRQEMGSFGRKRVERELAWDYEAPKLLAAYETVFRSKQKSGAPDAKPLVLLTGPDLEAVSGVSTHLKQILGSNLKDKFRFVHFQVGSQGRTENAFQRAFRILFSPLQFARCILSNKPDIVHLNPSMDIKSFWRDAVYLQVAKLLRCKTIYQMHGGDLPQAFCEKRPIHEFVLRKSLTASDEIVLLGDYAVQAYEEFHSGLPLNKIQNTIDLLPFAEIESKSLPEGEIVLGYIGRLADNKGIFQTLEGLSHLKDDPLFEKITFKIAGSGPSDSALRQKSRALGLDQKVVFLGSVFGDEKVKFWKEIHLFVFPTFHKEGLPYAVLESLASATPLITSPRGGIGEVVQHGVHGLFVDPLDTNSIASAIRKLTGENSRFERMSSSCLETVRKNFSIEVTAKHFGELYSRLYMQKSRPLASPLS